jgi:hypothetical protein
VLLARRQPSVASALGAAACRSGAQSANVPQPPWDLAQDRTWPRREANVHLLNHKDECDTRRRRRERDPAMYSVQFSRRMLAGLPA